MSFAAPRRSPRLIAIARGDGEADLLITGARLFSPLTRSWIATPLAIADGVVVGWTALPAREQLDADGALLVPGFIDAHVHLESTKLWVNRFVEAVVPMGTVAVASDPHEMANVAGLAGVRAMIEAARGMPITIGVCASSCVPASRFESPGATFDRADMAAVLGDPSSLGVAEVMDYPGVIAGDEELLAKIALAGERRVDGHAPGLRGSGLDAYLVAGVESDHEMVTLEEVEEKRAKGMWVFLRHGSASRNLAGFVPTVRTHGTAQVALCSDDREPDLLETHGHVNDLVRIAVASGMELEDALVLATLNPALYHGFDGLGHLGPGRWADLLVYPDREALEAGRPPALVLHRGRRVAEDGRLVVDLPRTPVPAGLRGSVRLARPLEAADFAVDIPPRARAIVAQDGSLWTGQRTVSAEDRAGVNRLAVVERHHATGRAGHGLVVGFGLTRGAIASTVAHDAHNLMVVGAIGAEADMAFAANRVAELGGGQVVVADATVLAEVPLSIAGLMSDAPLGEVARSQRAATAAAHELGCALPAPFMTLAFLGLSVIPELKLTDRGLVDAAAWKLVDLAV
jgi:adenine deaminase